MVLLAAWQISAVTVNKPLLLPTVPSVLAELARMMQTQQFWLAILASIRTLIQSWGLAIVIIAAAISLSVSSTYARSFFDRLSSMFMPMPAISLLPIMMLCFGIGNQTIAAMIVWGALWVNYHQLINNIDQARNRWQDQARNLGMSGIRALRLVYFPAMAGSSLAALQVSFGLAWRAQMALEIVFGAMGTFSSLGSMMMEERANMNTPMVWSCMLVIMMIGITVDRLFSLARQRIKW